MFNQGSKHSASLVEESKPFQLKNGVNDKNLHDIIDISKF